MGIKKNIEITAEVMSVKASRLQADTAMQQAKRLLQDEQVLPLKTKKGKQALRGRVRIERSVRVHDEVDFNDEVERDYQDYHWGVVCHTAHGEWYVTTAAMLEDRINLNSVQVRNCNDRVIGVMGFWTRDVRFVAIGWAHRDWAESYPRIILGWSSDGEYYFYRK